MVPTDDSNVERVTVGPGDVILMDIRLTHRGSTEEDMGKAEHAANPKLLVTTVCGGTNKPLTQAMELGNFKRMKDWDNKNAEKKYITQ